MDALKSFIDLFADPRLFFTLTLVSLILVVWKREAFASNTWGWGLMGFLVALFGFGLTDENFNLIITKPDNVPIVGLIFLLLFFTWYSVREGVLNDRRIAAGQPPIEKDEEDRVWTWPDLVYTELIAIVICTVIIIVWSIGLDAPLEQPANNANTPNPSKAPWYFLGLQEMLVYFDPWLAGVVLPSLIIVGLMAIPYIDKNPKGNGYYTFTERRVEITIFLFGFVVLWSSLIVLGTFLRGPQLELLRAVRVLGHSQARGADERPVVGGHLGAAVRDRATRELVHPGDIRHSAGCRLHGGPAGAAGEEGTCGLLRKTGRGTLLRHRAPLPVDVVAASEDADAVVVQSEVHRLDSGIFLQYLAPWQTRGQSDTPTTSIS